MRVQSEALRFPLRSLCAVFYFGSRCCCRVVGENDKVTINFGPCARSSFSLAMVMTQNICFLGWGGSVGFRPPSISGVSVACRKRAKGARPCATGRVGRHVGVFLVQQQTMQFLRFAFRPFQNWDRTRAVVAGSKSCMLWHALLTRRKESGGPV